MCIKRIIIALLLPLFNTPACARCSVRVLLCNPDDTCCVTRVPLFQACLRFYNIVIALFFGKERAL